MQANPLRAATADGRVPAQTMLGSGSAHVARAVAQIRFDSLLLDMEHGPLTTETLYAVVPAAGPCPFVRVPSCDLDTMKKAVDAGALGVVCPDVDTPEQAAAVAEACSSRFRDVLAVVQIESVRGYESVEQILAVPGLDAVFPGPSDLSVAFGGAPGVDYVLRSTLRGCGGSRRSRARRDSSSGFPSTTATRRVRCSVGRIVGLHRL